MKNFDLYLKTYELSELRQVLGLVNQYQLYNSEKKEVVIVGSGIHSQRDLIETTLGRDVKLICYSEFIVQAQGLYAYMEEYHEGVYSLSSKYERKYLTSKLAMSKNKGEVLTIAGTGIGIY